MLVVSGLVKKYNSFTAVKDVSLTIKPGDLYGFLGPNGAGKTTTIKVIAGLLNPTHGSVSINGIDLLTDPEGAKKELGYVPDQPYLYERLTGEEFLFFSAGLYSLKHAEAAERVREVIALLKLGEWVGRRTESYSQGMKQRIAIAAAFLHRPKLILIDEPMVGLDPQSARIVKDVLRAKAAEGCAVLMSTHSLHIAEEICTRIAVINNGAIIFNDGLAELKAFKDAQYKNLEEFFLELVKE